MRAATCSGIAALLILSAAITSLAQGTAPPEPADATAYRALYNAPVDAKIHLAEKFLADASPVFSDSQYRGQVYLILLQTGLEKKNWTSFLSAVDRMDKLAPKTEPKGRLELYTVAWNIATKELKDGKKSVAYAEKLITLDPNQVNGLLTLSTQVSDEASDAELNKTIEYGRRLTSLPKPDSMTSDEWQSIVQEIKVLDQSLVAGMSLKKAQASSALTDWIGCAREYDTLVGMTPKDSSAQYRLAFCYLNQTRAAFTPYAEVNKAHIAVIEECNKTLTCDEEENKKNIDELTEKEATLQKAYQEKRDKARDAFARAVAIGGRGPEVAQSRTELEKIFRNQNAEKPETKDKPLEGLEELVAQKKKELGIASNE